jgi:hypothetical protein
MALCLPLTRSPASLSLAPFPILNKCNALLGPYFLANLMLGEVAGGGCRKFAEKTNGFYNLLCTRIRLFFLESVCFFLTRW